ncbi:MAG: undecaprenyldiphospho-muramoylpentapeptide beta-N-acetylglucosaminyltransferase [Spirulina sp. SIO3F2]|nr:undecaprenyldiphospho-muramoylpentapeptide beta-N-acetylglucosaminyltransferase [Spirulina sp. SIO3F2]
MRVLIAASGTGGHIFPALAVAQQLSGAQIDWLGVPDRLEQTLIQDYPLHSISVSGFQGRPGLHTLRTLSRLIRAILRVKQMLKTLNVDVVFTTGGYIAAPAILAARWQGIPVMLHESNAIPGKVTRLLARFCTQVAVGFTPAANYLPSSKTRWTSTPVRENFLSPQTLELPVPEAVPLVVVVGGSQGAVAVNQLVRDCAPAWLATGAYIVHLTGDRDPQAQAFEHPHYIALPFYHNMAGLLQRATLAVGRSGAGTLTELAITQTPAVLIPYPFAAEDHQYHNAMTFVEQEAALVFRQAQLTAKQLEQAVLELLQSPERLAKMAAQAETLAVKDSAAQLAQLLIQYGEA